MNAPSLLLLAMLSAGASFESHYGTTKSAKNTDSAQTTQRGSDSLPLTVKLVKTNESKEQAVRDSTRIQIERGIAVSTLRWTKVAGVSAIILALFAVLTWDVIRRTSQRQLRAYLGFSHRWIHGKRNEETGRLETEQLEITKEDENRYSYKTGIYVANHGQSPAEVYFKGTCCVLTHPAERQAIFEALDKADVTRYVEAAKLANPGIELPLYYELRSSGASKQPTATERIYSFGTVLYKDIFNRWHFNNVCLFYNADSTTGSTWETAKYFNDAGNISNGERRRRFAALWPPEPAPPSNAKG